jgi:hypothetical protein
VIIISNVRIVCCCDERKQETLKNLKRKSHGMINIAYSARAPGLRIASRLPSAAAVMIHTAVCLPEAVILESSFYHNT